MSVLPATKTDRSFLTEVIHETNALFSSTSFLSLVLIIISFFFLLPSLLKPMETEVDAYSRYASAIISITSNNLFTLDGGVWLPLHPIFLAPSIILFPNSSLAPRLETVFVSLWIPILLFLITKHLLKRTNFAFFTALFYACLPLFTEIGTTTLTEPLFLCLFLTGLYCFLKRRWEFWIVFMIASQALRFEAWFVTPLFMYALLQQPEIQVKKKLSLFILLCIFPVLYSLYGQTATGSTTAYLDQMSEMARVSILPGAGNWHRAVADWLTFVPQVIPGTFLFLCLIGIYQFLQQGRTHVALEQHRESLLLFFVLPFFLFLMLPIQVFLDLRDWLPVRYLLIPTTLAFPLVGLGIQALLQRFPFKVYLPLYGLVMLFCLFELRSLSQNTRQLLSTFSHDDFIQLTQEANALRTKVKFSDDAHIAIFEPSAVKDQPMLYSSVLTWLLLPSRAVITEVDSHGLKVLLEDHDVEKVIVAGINQQVPSEYNLVPLATTPYHVFLTPNRSSSGSATFTWTR